MFAKKCQASDGYGHNVELKHEDAEHSALNMTVARDHNHISLSTDKGLSRKQPDAYEFNSVMVACFVTCTYLLA